MFEEVKSMHISAQRKYQVQLTTEEKIQVQTLLRKGMVNARTITRARILLLADEGKKDKDIYTLLHTAKSTPHDIRRKYTENGLAAALYDAPRPGKERILSGEQEAEVIAIACSEAPKGYVRWTMDLLTEEVHKRMGVTIGRTAIWKVLLRNDIKPWQKKMWCIPNVTDDFKQKMLDVLEVYERPYDEQYPVVCLDEKSNQLLKETRTPLLQTNGKPYRGDYEYKRNGTCNLFVAIEPKAKKRFVVVTKHRGKYEFARMVGL
jgi:transposase